MLNRQIRLRRRPDGPPGPDDFELVETSSPTLGAGQILCRARWLSLDPHARLAMNGRPLHGCAEPGEVIPSRAVAEVVESRNDVFAVGACVELEHGLQNLSVSAGEHVHLLRAGQNPASTALGILGVPGMKAYFGLLEVARVQPRETVLVSTAAGATGSMAGQIAMLRGARAIGLTNSHEKCEWVMRTGRFTACIDTHSADVSARLRALAPKGIDIFFDDAHDDRMLGVLLVGSHFSSNGRVLRHVHDAAEPQRLNGVRVAPIDVARYAGRREEFLKVAMAWYGEGLLVYREDVVEGLQNAPAHYCRLMRGENFGKPLVRV
jgi:NADPH-dependent curcumin reductase